jgi:hypothetical protein
LLKKKKIKNILLDEVPAKADATAMKELIDDGSFSLVTAAAAAA